MPSLTWALTNVLPENPLAPLQLPGPARRFCPVGSTRPLPAHGLTHTHMLCHAVPSRACCRPCSAPQSPRAPCNLILSPQNLLLPCANLLNSQGVVCSPSCKCRGLLRWRQQKKLSEENMVRLHGSVKGVSNQLGIWHRNLCCSLQVRKKLLRWLISWLSQLEQPNWDKSLLLQLHLLAGKGCCPLTA